MNCLRDASSSPAFEVADAEMVPARRMAEERFARNLKYTLPLKRSIAGFAEAIVQNGLLNLTILNQIVTTFQRQLSY